MIIRLIIFVLLFCFSLPATITANRGASGEGNEKSCVPVGWPHERSDLKPHPDIIYNRLENGFGYILLKNRYPEKRSALYLNVNTGSLFETAEEQGIAHYLEHLVFNGSTHFEPGELVKYFQSIGMSYGGDTNAFTTYEDTVYKIILPESNEEMVKGGLLVLSDYARGALLLPEEIDSERSIILAEMNERNSASLRAYQARTKSLFAGTLLPQRFVIGKKEIIDTANDQIIRTFYDKWYRPENMFLVMVGDFEPAVVERLIKKQFENMEGAATSFSCPDYGTIGASGIHGVYHYEPELGYTSLAINVIDNTVRYDDSLDRQVKNLHRYMAAHILNTRLEEEMELSGSVLSSARYFSGSTLCQFIKSGISARTKPEKWQEGLAAINRILQQALIYGFTDEEVEMAQKELLSSLLQALMTVDTRNSISLASDILRGVNSNQVLQSPQQEWELYGPVIRKTTRDEIYQAFLEGWQRDTRFIEVVGNAEIDNADPTQFISHYYSQLQRQNIAALEKKDTVVFPYLSVPDAVPPVSTETLESIGSTRYRYANGTILQLKKTPFKKNSVSIAIHFGGGVKGMPKGGLSLLTEAVINGSGTGTLRPSALSRALSGRTLNYRFEIGDDSFRLYGNALLTDLDALIQVLHAMILDPGLRSDVFQRQTRTFDLMYQQLEGDIDGAAVLYLEPFIHGNLNILDIVDRETFKKHTLEDIKKWVLPAFNTEPLEISVVGDFAEDELVALISRYFGSLPNREASVTIPQQLPSYPAGQTYEKNVTLSEDKGLVRMTWLTDDYWEIAQTRHLNILAAILDERLRKMIREEEGNSYSPSAYSTNSKIYPGFGLLTAEVTTTAAELDSVSDSMTRVVRSLLDTPVTEEELERAKRPIITSITERSTSNRYWLHTVLSLSSRYPIQLAWADTFFSDYIGTTTDDIERLIRLYVRDDRLATGVIRAGNQKLH